MRISVVRTYVVKLGPEESGKSPRPRHDGSAADDSGNLVRALGLVDTLRELPPETEGSSELTERLERLADALVAHQDAHGGRRRDVVPGDVGRRLLRRGDRAGHRRRTALGRPADGCHRRRVGRSGTRRPARHVPAPRSR